MKSLSDSVDSSLGVSLVVTIGPSRKLELARARTAFTMMPVNDP